MPKGKRSKTPPTLAKQFDVKPKQRVQLTGIYTEASFGWSRYPEVFRDRSRGGLGLVAGQSAALFWAMLLDGSELLRLEHAVVNHVNEVAKAEAGRYANGPVYTEKEIRDQLSDCRRINVYAWVARAALRHFGEAALNDGVLASALYGYVYELNRREQAKLARHVTQRHERQLEIDAEARDALVLCCSDAASSSEKKREPAQKQPAVDTKHGDRPSAPDLAVFENILPGHKARREVIARIVATLAKQHKYRLVETEEMLATLSQRSYPAARDIERVALMLANKPDDWVRRYADAVEESLKG